LIHDDAHHRRRVWLELFDHSLEAFGMEHVSRRRHIEAAHVGHDPLSRQSSTSPGPAVDDTEQPVEEVNVKEVRDLIG
jgi:hypothetical protein